MSLQSRESNIVHVIGKDFIEKVSVSVTVE